MKPFFFAILAVFLTSSSRIVFAGPSAPANTNDSNSPKYPEDTVVARGKGFSITKRQMGHVIASAVAANPNAEFPPDVEARILTHLIEIQLVLQEVTDEEKAVARRNTDVNFTNIMKNMGDKFERQLQATSMTAEELRRSLFEEEAAQNSLTRQLAIHVSDADAKKYFDAHPGAYDQPERVHIRELVLLTTTDWTRADASSLPPDVIKAKHESILDLHKRILTGEDFAALARRYNEHPLSKDNDNELTFAKDQMEIGNLAYAMKANEISDVVMNEGNYCIFQLLGILPAKKAEFPDVAQQIKSALAGEQKRAMAPRYIRKLWKQADVKIFDAKLKLNIEKAEAQAANAENARTELRNKMAAQRTVTNAAPTPLKAEETANEPSGAQAEQNGAGTLKSQDAIARLTAQYTNAPQQGRIPAPKPSAAKP